MILTRVHFTYRRDKIITVLKCLFAMQTKKNLPIFDIDEQNLRNWTTTEKDMKRGIAKFPPVEYRNVHEDLLPRDPTPAQQQQ